MLYPAQREELLRVVQQLVQKNLIQLSSGNVSMRVSPDHLLITPTSVPYEIMTAEDIVVITPGGEQIEGRHAPSSETPMHTIVYRQMPGVEAVIHTHSLHAMAFAVVGEPIPVISTEGLAPGGPVPVAEYACPGTEAQGWAALRAMQGPPVVRAALLRNHGLLAIGPSLARAFSIACQVEMAAQVYFLSLQIGRPVPLTSEQVNEIITTYASIKTAAAEKTAGRKL